MGQVTGDEDACKYLAAYGGYLDCLIWAREHGCDWDSETCSAAAQEGHLDCLIWAREMVVNETCLIEPNHHVQCLLLIKSSIINIRT